MGRISHCSTGEIKIVSTLRKSGPSLRSIAVTMNCKQNALKPKNPVKMLGRPKKTPKATDIRIVRLSKENPFKSLRAISTEIGNVIVISS